jgi:hypothetical protein
MLRALPVGPAASMAHASVATGKARTLDVAPLLPTGEPTPTLRDEARLPVTPLCSLSSREPFTARPFSSPAGPLSHFRKLPPVPAR